MAEVFIASDIILREGDRNKRNYFFSNTIKFIFAPKIQVYVTFIDSLRGSCQITWKNDNSYNLFSAFSALGYEYKLNQTLKKRVEELWLLYFLW